MRESLELILTEISDILEGGDIVEDFESNPYAVGIIRSINAIVENELRAIRATKNLENYVFNSYIEEWLTSFQGFRFQLRTTTATKTTNEEYLN